MKPIYSWNFELHINRDRDFTPKSIFHLWTNFRKLLNCCLKSILSFHFITSLNIGKSRKWIEWKPHICLSIFLLNNNFKEKFWFTFIGSNFISRLSFFPFYSACFSLFEVDNRTQLRFHLFGVKAFTRMFFLAIKAANLEGAFERYSFLGLSKPNSFLLLSFCFFTRSSIFSFTLLRGCHCMDITPNRARASGVVSGKKYDKDRIEKKNRGSMEGVINSNSLAFLLCAG